MDFLKIEHVVKKYGEHTVIDDVSLAPIGLGAIRALWLDVELV